MYVWPISDIVSHMITGQGVEAEDDKITAMLHWPIPHTLKELRGFLGLTGYYRRFVHNYGTIAAPLTTLTRKDEFKWSVTDRLLKH